MIELATLRIDDDASVLTVRHAARELAALVGFDTTDQVRIATAVSELGRVVVAANTRARVTLLLAAPDPAGQSDIAHILVDIASDSALDLSPDSPMTAALAGARRLSHTVTIDTKTATRLQLSKALPSRGVDSIDANRLRSELKGRLTTSPLEELRAQNLDLLRTLEELTARQDELQRLNAELQETNSGVLAMYAQLSEELEQTNRGVVALYAELDERGGQLRAASQAKSRFLASVSHELRSPLNSVIALAQLLRDEDSDPLTAEQAEQIDQIRFSAGNLLALTNDLLDQAKAESGALHPQVDQVDLGRLFADLRATMRPITPAGVRLAFDIDADPPVVETDPILLPQLLRNLVSNAIKFTEVGHVRVRADLVGRDRVAFTVVDTGIGIAQENHDLVFEEFFQVPGRLQTRSKGTGLGLPYARLIARSLGGTLEFTSTPGAGSTFVAVLPIGRPARAGPGDGQPRIGRALLVDDEAAFRLVLRNLLAAISDEIIEAVDATTAIEQMRRSRPDVVFLDLKLPDGSGESVLIEAAGDDVLCRIPIIVVTSAELTASDRADLRHAAAVISKAELSPAAVAQAVRDAVDGGRQ